MKHYILLLAILTGGYFTISAQIYESIQTGAFEDGTTWAGGSAPKLAGGGGDDFSDAAVIHAGTVVTVGGGLQAKSGSNIEILDGGELIIAGNVDFDNGCVVTVHEGGKLTVLGSGTNSNNSDQVTINGSMDIGGNFDGGTGSAIEGTGTVAVTGDISTTGTGTVFGSTGSCEGGCVTSGSTPLDGDGDYRTNGSDPDLSVASAWDTYSATVWSTAGSAPDLSSSANAPNKVVIRGGSNVDLGSSAVFNTLIIEASASFNQLATMTISSGKIMTISSGGTFTSAAAVTNNGTINNNGSYVHSQNGGTVPTCTWKSGSSITITTTSTMPSGLTQNFQDFVWNSAGQTTDLTFPALSIGGEFTLTATNGNAVLLAGATSLTGRVTLTEGYINTNGNILELTSETAADLSYGTSGSSGIIATSASGALRRHINNDGVNAGTYGYPLSRIKGTGGYYLMELVNAGLNGNGFDYLDVYIVQNAESGNNVSSRSTATQGGTPLNYIWQEEWIMSPDAEPSGGTYDLRLYTANVNVGNGGTLQDNKFTVVKRSNPGNADYADYNTFDGSTTIPGHNAVGRTVASGYAQKRGFTDFSGASGGGGDDNLPITLLEFKAEHTNGQVDLFWKTASEINNDYFTIERSSDGTDFTPIVEVKGAGTSNQVLEYTATDPDPIAGTSYYRLKQTDFDEAFDYSQIRSVNVLKPLNFSVKPNPATERLEITFGEIKGGSIFVMTPEYKAKISIYNAEGKMIYRKKFDGTFYKFQIDVSPFDNGLYMVNLETKGQIYNTKFVKE